MSVDVVRGDALAALAEGRIQVLGHQVNLLGVMGAGIAAAIRKEYPIAFTEYAKAVRSQALALGGLLMSQVGDARWVAHLAGQRGVGGGVRQTQYAALAAALAALAQWTSTSGLTVGLPYGIGCGLGGGEWPVVSGLIAEAFEAYEVTLFRL